MSVVDFCKNCGGPIYEGDTECENCGCKVGPNSGDAPLPPEPTPERRQIGFCTQCGSPVYEGDTECGICGHKVGSNSGDKSRPPLERKAIGFCAQCGAPVYKGETKCSQCGTPVKSGNDLPLEYLLIAVLTILLSAIITMLVKSGKVSNYEVVIKDCTWQQAFEESKKAGGHLVMIETEKEFKTLTKLIEQKDLGDLRLYISAARNDDSTEYHWIDDDYEMRGKPLNDKSSYLFTKWEGGEPSYEENGTVSNRVELVHKLRGYWKIKDIPDDMLSAEPQMSDKTGYIIEYD